MSASTVKRRLSAHLSVPLLLLSLLAAGTHVSRAADGLPVPLTPSPVEKTDVSANPTLYLKEAVRTPNAAEIELALNAGAEITDEILWLAAVHADPEILNFLLKTRELTAAATFSLAREAGPNQEDTEAGAELRSRLISLLSRGGKEKSLDGVTLLHLAALVGNTEIARSLHEDGALLDAKLSTGLTPLTVAYASWLRSWNPMKTAPGAFTALREDTNFPGFIYYLLDKGADRQPLEDLLETERDSIENYVLSLTTRFPLRMADGTVKPLGEVLEGACERVGWGLVDYQLFDRRASNYCREVVIFFARLKSDNSSIRVPFLFLDNDFLIPGFRVMEEGYEGYRNGAPITHEEAKKFWEDLGVQVPAATRPVSAGHR